MLQRWKHCRALRSQRQHQWSPIVPSAPACRCLQTASAGCCLPWRRGTDRQRPAELPSAWRPSWYIPCCQTCLVTWRIDDTCQGRPQRRMAACALLQGHYASCTADTWASEVGILSTSPPRLITTLQVCTDWQTRLARPACTLTSGCVCQLRLRCVVLQSGKTHAAAVLALQVTRPGVNGGISALGTGAGLAGQPLHSRHVASRTNDLRSSPPAEGGH